MKTILLIALAGFLAINCNAQNANCKCAKKVVHHHKKTTTDNIKTTNRVTKTTTPYSAKRSVVFIPGNSVTDDTAGDVVFLTEREYTGLYPDASFDINEPIANNSLIVSSSAFKNYGTMPSKYTCEGESASPPLAVHDIPAETQSIAIIMYDPKANAKGNETYWVIWDIDTATAANIPENFVNDHEGLNVAHEYGYHAACPLSDTHYYHFAVYALDTKLIGNRQTTRERLQRAMHGHVLAKGELVGIYDRL